MRAIILSAGIGSRLHPITLHKPKTLVSVNGKPILGHALDALISANVQDVVICCGYKAQQVIDYCQSNYPKTSFSFVENTKFTTTNNAYSLYLASKYFEGDVIIMNGDIIVDKRIVQNLIKEKSSCFAVDKDEYIEESMKVVVEKGMIKNISKTISKEKAYGCSIDLYYIKNRDISIFKLELKRFMSINSNKNQWTEVLLDQLVKTDRLTFKPFDISGKWFEIDNLQDLSTAELLFNKNVNKLKKKEIFFIDKDGTLAIGNQILPGAREFISKLIQNNKAFMLLTNNSSKTPIEHLAEIRKIDRKITIKNILVSTTPAISYLKRNNLTKVFWVANKSVSLYLSQSGLIYEESFPQAILLTYDTEIDYRKLVLLSKLVRKNIPYLATHEDLVCPTDTGPIPDIGCYIKTIEISTGRLPDHVFGKPKKSLILSTLKERNLTYADAVIIGDRLYTDMKMAENSEMTSILVLTGETSRAMYEDSATKADIVSPDLHALVHYID